MFIPYSHPRSIDAPEAWLIATVLISQLALFVSFLGLSPVGIA